MLFITKVPLLTLINASANFDNLRIFYSNLAVKTEVFQIRIINDFCQRILCQQKDNLLFRAVPNDTHVIYLPLFGDAGDRLITWFSLRPIRGCESTNDRGSDRKREKCQNSISKQIMKIVTLFMLNKK